MKSRAGLAGGIANALALANAVSAQTLPSITFKGKHMFYSNQTQFYIRGVAYQQDYIANGTVSQNQDYTDPLANAATCNRDIPYLKRLRTNVIRTYAVDPTQDHTACMNAFANAGIYVISDLSAPTPLGSINRNTPDWTTDLFSRYTALIDDLSQFPNTIGFFAGNEVANSQNTTASAAFVKAAVRDSKYYVAQTVNRPLYVGYATSDDTGIRDQMADYLNCDSETANNVDFFGYNIYSWCDPSTYQASGYAERTEFFQDYSVPVFFAEYGCNKNEPRQFQEVGALFSEPMTSVWSGGIVYQYFQETNNYGLVNVQGNNVTPRQDYDNLSSQMAKIFPTSTSDAAVSTDVSPARCPAVDATWSSTPSPLPNRPNQDLCDCITPVFPCVVGDDTDEDEYGDLFGYICGPQSGGSYCVGIAHNSTTGTYGAYSMCDSKTQLSYVMSKYYSANRAKAGTKACSFNGAAGTQPAQSPTGSCLSLIQAAGDNGQGTVPSSLASASYTASAGSGSGSGSGSSSTGNAAAQIVPGLNHALYYSALCAAGAGAMGAGMLLL